MPPKTPSRGRSKSPKPAKSPRVKSPARGKSPAAKSTPKRASTRTSRAAASASPSQRSPSPPKKAAPVPKKKGTKKGSQKDVVSLAIMAAVCLIILPMLAITTSPGSAAKNWPWAMLVFCVLAMVVWTNDQVYDMSVGMATVSALYWMLVRLL